MVIVYGCRACTTSNLTKRPWLAGVVSVSAVFSPLTACLTAEENWRSTVKAANVVRDTNNYNMGKYTDYIDYPKSG